jgi:hypothetical protein
MDIPIDTSKYEAQQGKPRGKKYWAFTIVSPSVTTRDKYYRVPEPMDYKKACEKVRAVAAMRRSDRIVLEPD